MTSIGQPSHEADAPSPVAGSALPLRPDRPAIRWPEIAALVVAGFLLEVSARGGLDNVASMLAVVTLVVTLLVSGRLQQRSARTLAVAAAALSPWLVVRSSGALTAANLAAIAALLALAVGLSSRGALTDLRARALGNHLFSQSVEWLHGLAMVRRLVAANSRMRQWRSVLRGLVVGAPIVALFTGLLASADDVFASFLLVDDLPALVGHVVATLALAVLLLGLVSRAAHRTAPYEAGGLRRPLGSTEITMMLAALVALFAAFVATQVAVALGGVDHVLETENLTQAEHARRGFFQLVFVAALTTGLLAVLRAIRPGGSALVDPGSDTAPVNSVDRFRPLAITLLSLTLVITAISVQRLVHYVETFGFTPLRLWSVVAAIWIGLVVVAQIVSIGGVAAARSWLPGFVVLSAAVFVFAMNVLNPDAFVARYNLTHETERAVDTSSIAALSDDAIPASLEKLGNLDPDALVRFGEQLCDRWDLDAGYGVLGLNRAERRADALLDEFCAFVPGGRR